VLLDAGDRLLVLLEVESRPLVIPLLGHYDSPVASGSFSEIRGQKSEVKGQNDDHSESLSDL